MPNELEAGEKAEVENGLRDLLQKAEEYQGHVNECDMQALMDKGKAVYWEQMGAFYRELERDAREAAEKLRHFDEERFASEGLDPDNLPGIDPGIPDLRTGIEAPPAESVTTRHEPLRGTAVPHNGGVSNAEGAVNEP